MVWLLFTMAMVTGQFRWTQVPHEFKSAAECQKVAAALIGMPGTKTICIGVAK